VETLVAVRDGRLWQHGRDQLSVAADEVYSVQVLWEPREPRTWLGWVTTFGHRAIRFSAAELADAAFRAWLADLPGWDEAKLLTAIEIAGLHLIWRTSSDADLTIAAFGTRRQAEPSYQGA
jgi:hypothetical protein